MKAVEALGIMRETGVVAIMRATDSRQLLEAAEAIRAGGVNCIEVTMTTPGALDVVRQARANLGDAVLFGVGSILDAETARAAILAGAGFIVCPTLDLGVISLCRRYSVPVVPGAFTPTEILKAWEAGADIVKVFPANVGGPAFIKAIKGPLPHVMLMPVGGVDLDTTADFIRSGSEMVGVGGSLVDQRLIDARDFGTITERARRFREEVDRGRGLGGRG
jgi:2-dehydro-3-deoxyphosphogluconate aldolase/(4S)-4-hydroxy-2-oxoglutarate aldolase